MSYRFVISQTPIEEVFREALLADVRAANLSWRYRAYYQIRSAIPLKIRHWLQHHRTITVDPDWYLPCSFLQQLEDRISRHPDSGPLIHPWPDAAQFALVLTHDVETAEGVANIPRIARLEEELGFRSSWNFVPQNYKVAPGLLRDLTERGFEIGVHGYNHDGKLYFSKSKFARRATAINDALDRFGAVGFRSPMVHRNPDWLPMLDIEYDASFFDADPYQAMPGGVGGIWPFVADGFVELPYTLPQDHTLFVVRREYDGETWRRKLEFLARHSGMALMLTHPDYMVTDKCLDVYRAFLSHVKDYDDFWHALPREVSQWWKDRDASVVQHHGDSATFIDGPVGPRGRLARLCSSGEGLFQPFQPVTDGMLPAGVRDS